MSERIETTELERLALVLDRGFGNPTFQERHNAAEALRELITIRAHTAAQPAPDAVAEAAIREAYEAGWLMTEAFCVHEDSYQMAAAERLENALTALRDAMPEVDQPAAKGPSA